MNPIIKSIYRDVLLGKRVPHQYFYQRLKGKLTGSWEISFRNADNTNHLFLSTAADEVTMCLSGRYYRDDDIIISICGMRKSRKELYKETLKWCIMFVRRSVKDIVKKLF